MTKLQVFYMMCLVLIFIIVDIFCDNFLGIIYGKAPPSEGFIFFIAFGVLQVVFAPFQSAASDVYGRKNGLVISLFFSLASLALIYLFKEIVGYWQLAIATLFKGVMGNTLPISLALIADTKHKNYRLLFACSTGAYALAYLVLAKVEALHLANLDEQLNFYLILAVIAALFIGILFLKNRKLDTGGLVFSSVMAREKKLIIKDLMDSPKRKKLSAFYLWETSMYVILLSQIDFHINKLNHIADFMMYGYLIGILFLVTLRRFEDSTIIKVGYFISFLSLVPYFFLSNFVEEISLLQGCYFFHALGNAFLSPAFLSLLATKLKPHQQGRTYGLTDSVDTIAYLSGAVVLLVVRLLNLNVIYLVLFSFLSFTISWKFYNQFPNENRGN